MTEIPSEAHTLHQEGRKAGAEGDLVRALELLFRAHQLAPDWAYPPYDIAFTYLLNEDLEEAEKWYAVVDSLEPRGFFTAKTFLHTIRRERSGELPRGFSKAFAMLEWLPEDTQRDALQKIVASFPAFAPAWKQLAYLTGDEDAKLEALNRGLAADPDDETYGMLMLNKALLVGRRGQRALGKQMLHELLGDQRCTAGVEALARMSIRDGSDEAKPN